MQVARSDGGTRAETREMERVASSRAIAKSDDGIGGSSGVVPCHLSSERKETSLAKKRQLHFDALYASLRERHAPVRRPAATDAFSIGRGTRPTKAFEDG